MSNNLFFYFLDKSLSSTATTCLKSDGNGVDLIGSDANSTNPLSFDDQCKFAHGNDYKKNNGQYQGNFTLTPF